MTDNSLDTTTQDAPSDGSSEPTSDVQDEQTNREQKSRDVAQDTSTVIEETQETAPEAPALPATPEPVPAAAVETLVAEVAQPEAEEADTGAEDEEDEEEEDYFFAPGDWYVVHTYAGYENKVRANLSSRIQSMNMEDKIYDVVVPTEEVMELKSGKMQSVQKKVFPGYILVRMELDDDSWYVVRNTPGVTGFVGSGAKPTPLDPSEVSKILAPKTEERPRPKLDYEVGEVVSVVAGPFNGYSGPVNAIEVDKQQVTVLLDLFGRETPVELTFDQVTKL